MKTIIHWISFAVLVFIFGYASIYKIIQLPHMMEGMQSMGFGKTWTLIIGWAEFLGVLGLIAGIFLPAVKTVSAIWLWPFAIGALTSHFSYHHPFPEYLNALLVTIAPAVLLGTDKHFKISIT